MTFVNCGSYLDEEGNLSSNCLHVPDIETVKSALKVMIQTRLVDERMVVLQRQGLITFALSSAGEEACAVASAAALQIGDWMYPQYREAGILFWRGFSIQDYLHHMFGDAKDLSLGRQMPNHFGSRALNVVTVSSPIGTKIPHAAGCAFAMLVQKDPHVAICYFGEGATSEGDFHVGLNFAAVRKVPCLFFCRNNGYAISTPTKRQYASAGVAPKGEGYGMASYRVDGNDFFAVYSTVKEARAQALMGNGPALIEAMTFRMGPHSTSDDPSLYRKEEEKELWKKRCPIARLRRYLASKGKWTENDEIEWMQKVNEEITKSIEEAKKTPKPALKTLIENVYFEVPDTLERQLEEAIKEDIPSKRLSS